MTSAAPDDLIYFTPDVTDAVTIKRVQEFLDHGCRLLVIGFRRERINRGYAPTWPHVLLGHTRDGRYGQRLLALLRAIPALFAQRRRYEGARIFYARNIDQLLLALLARLFIAGRPEIVYEVLDIPPILMGRGPASIVLRWLERLCLQRVRMLVLSSPGFHKHYFASVQRYRGPWFLLENKLHPSIRQSRPAAPDAPAANRRRRLSGRWVVAYCGLIRGQETIDLIARLAERLGDRVTFRFHGVLTTVDEAAFHETVARLPNVTYEGEYSAHRDLKAIYGDIDFAWALDLEHVDHNSRWLLPCRFYEAGFLGVPCLAVHGFEVGDMIERLDAGWTFDRPLEDNLVRFFERLTPAAYEEMREKLLALPPGRFVAGEDVAVLCEKLGLDPRDDEAPPAVTPVLDRARG